MDSCFNDTNVQWNTFPNYEQDKLSQLTKAVFSQPNLQESDVMSLSCNVNISEKCRKVWINIQRKSKLDIRPYLYAALF